MTSRPGRSPEGGRPGGVAGAGASSPAGAYARSAGLLSIGVGSAGLLTYLYFALASHSLPAAGYGEIVILWSAVCVVAITLYRPIEQLLSRTIAERRAASAADGDVIRTAAAIQLALATIVAVASLALKGPLEDDLFHGNGTVYWIFVGTVVAFAVSYFGRGVLAGSRRFIPYAALVVTEAGARLGFAATVAVGIAGGQSAVALGILAAPIAGLLVIPLALGRRRGGGAAVADGGESGPGVRAVTGAAGPGMESPSPSEDASALPAPPEPAGESERLTLVRGGGFALAVVAIMLSEQVLLNAGPLILGASEGAEAAAFIFNVLMVARAPLLLFQAVATTLLPHLTHLRTADGEADRRAFAHSVAITVRAVVAFTAVVVAVVAAAGPTLMEIAFGGELDYPRSDLLIVAVAMGFYLSAVTLNQAAIAEGHVRRAAACWLGCSGAFAAWVAVGPLEPFLRVELGFAVAAVALTGLLYGVYRRAPAPG